MWTSPRARAFAIAVAIAIVQMPAAGSARADEPPRLVLQLDRADQFPYPYALEELAWRALDCAGYDYRPVELADQALGRIRSALPPASGPLESRARGLVASEGRKLGFDHVAVMRTRIEPQGLVLTISGSRAPFEETFSFESGHVSIDDFAGTIPALTESLAARTGLARRAGFSPGDGPAARPFPRASWQSEDLYVEGARYGDFVLLEEALAADSTNEAARSLFGFRLTLGDYPRFGWELLAQVDETRLSPWDRAVHRARLDLARPGVSSSENAVALRDEFPERFESELLYAIPFARRGDIRTADRAIRNAIRLRPHDPLPHRVLAEAGLRAGIPDVAAREFALADRLARGDWLSIIGIASTKYTQGFTEDALDILTQPMPPRLHSWSVYYKYLLARANLSLAFGENGAAIRRFTNARDRAYRAGHREAVLHLTSRLVWTYLEAGHVEQAAYEAAELRFEQDTSYFYQANPGIVPFLEGVVAAYAGDLGEVSARRLELDTDPDAPEHYALIVEGLYYLKGGSAWEGIPALRRAHESHPDSHTRFLLGLAYFESGDESRARTVLEDNVERGESLLDTPPTLPLSFFYLGRALEKRGDRITARIAFGEFLNYRKRVTENVARVAYARERVGYR